MTIHETTEDGVLIVAPVGRIDSTTSGAVEDSLTRLTAGGALQILVDFAEVDYISSAGLRVLLVLAKRMKTSGGRLVLCGMPHSVRQVFHLAGFMPLFRIEPSRDAARAVFAAHT